MAIEIKSLYIISEKKPFDSRFLHLECTVMSHVNNLAILLRNISGNFIGNIEQQLSWGLRVCCEAKKMYP